MYKSRMLLVLGVISLLFVTVAVSQPLSNTSEAASDFHQRHPKWTWTANDSKAVIPVTGDAAFPDYYQRHPELSVPAEASVDTTDYYFRHLGLGASVKSADLTDYFFRHPELRGELTRTGDMTDHYFRHSGN